MRRKSSPSWQNKECQMRYMVFVWVVIMFAEFGCATQPARGEDLTSGFVSLCDVNRCGGNSPVVDSFNFHELNLAGLPNAEGLRLSRFVQGNAEWTPSVVGGKLSGYRDTKAIAGAELVGAQLIIADDTGRELAIVIAGVGATSIRYFPLGRGVLPSVNYPIETYELQVRQPGTAELVPLCGGDPENPASSASGMAPGSAVLFEGDRIDAVHKTVSPTMDPSWFNIGCAGGVLAKLALTGHTESLKDHYGTTWDQRQALLKLLVGDYCGTGTAYTVSGQPLYWKDSLHLMEFPDSHVHAPIEARWSSHGAICVGQPRLDANPPASWPEMLSKPVMTDILTECPDLPPCSDTDPFDQDGAYLISANPVR